MFKKNDEQFDGNLKPIESADQQTTSEVEIVAFVKNKIEEARSSPSRIQWEANTLTNSAYLTGLDSVYFDSRSRSFRPLSGLGSLPSRARVHANLILPTINNRLARLLQNPPKFDVFPNTNSVEDKDGARLALKFIGNKWDSEHLDEKRQELGMWQQQGGHGWVKVYWDDLKGDPLPDIRELDPITQEPIGPEEIHHEGDVCAAIRSPFNIFCDPLAKSQSELGWLVDASIRPLSYFHDHYGERGRAVKQEGAWLLSLQNLLKINNMSNKGSSSEDDRVMRNCAIEIAYFEKPSKHYPKGRMIITANGVLLKYDELPCEVIPYVKFDDTKVAGKFFAESLITHLRPLQDQYNRNLRKKAEYINRGLALKILAVKGAGLTQESINDTTEVIQYNPVEGASPPKDMPSPQMPQYVFNEDANLKAQFSEIGGISETSKGQLPAASIPGIGIQLLQEADTTRLSIITASNENSWALVMQIMVRYASKYYITKRYLKECGEDGEFNYTEFTGEDLRNSYDVRCVKGSTLPHSKSQQRQDIINAHERGYLGDPMDPVVRQKVFTKLEFGDIQGLWDDLRTDLHQIKRSIEMIERGIPPQVDPDDNHQLHFDQKNNLRKSEKFETYSPIVQNLLKQNIAQHKMFLLPPMPPTVPMGPELPPQGPEIPMAPGV